VLSGRLPQHPITEAGFTLIEMMVALLIMAVLLAIAIPAFLGVQGGTQDRAVQSNLSNALTSARSLYGTTGGFPALRTIDTSLNSQEPELSFVSKAATQGSNEISLNVSSSGQQLLLVAYSTAGTCWAISDNGGDSPADAFGQAPIGTWYVSWNPSASGGKACNAANALGSSEGKALAGSLWSPAFPIAPPEAKP
jgi:prepilin-type N-terminal cleavage/methylation domain-containing protein